MRRVGQFCFRHSLWVLAAWVVAVVLGVLATGPLFGRLADSGLPHDVESVAANDIISAGNDSAGTVVGIIDGVDPTDPRVRAAVDRADLAHIDGVRAVQPPVPAPDGRAVLVSVTLAAMDRATRDATSTAISTALHGLSLPPGATVQVGGSPVLNMDNRHAVQQDLRRAEYTSLPITLVVLVVVFGGLAAAGLPVLTAAVSVAAAMGVLLGFSFVTDVDQDGVTVVTLLGLALAIDYGLLLVARYREELRTGVAREQAVGRAWETAGRTVAFSALTVAAALSGLLAFHLPTLTALGAAGVSIAVVCLAASLTFTAALLGLLQRWISPPRREKSDERGAFVRISRFVQRWPALIALGTVAVLLAAGTPLMRAQIRLPGLEGIPRSIESARVADQITNRFDRPPAAAITVVARTDVATLSQWAEQFRPAVARIRPAQALTTRGVATIGFDVAGDPQSAATRDLVQRMRANRPPGTQSWVTGDAAVLADLLGIIRAALPVALSVTVLAMIVLLFLMTGSLVVPIKAILANLVSLGATFGVMTAVFQYGYGSSLLDTLTVAALNPFVLVVIFAFAFGLSMDYEVFLLGRIKEYVDSGMPTDAAVRRGLQHTGRVITSAALLMVIVFSCFVAARIGNIEQIGLGLTTAVLVDATIVRCLLVPATMTLLGRWNWWAPGWLTRLHRRAGLSHDRRAPAPPAPRPRAGVALE